MRYTIAIEALYEVSGTALDNAVEHERKGNKPRGLLQREIAKQCGMAIAVLKGFERFDFASPEEVEALVGTIIKAREVGADLNSFVITPPKAP